MLKSEQVLPGYMLSWNTLWSGDQNLPRTFYVIVVIEYCLFGAFTLYNGYTNL